MEPLTKKSLNNFIVKMRHNVRRARVQTVNRLNRVVKKLKEKKGTDEQKKQNAAKAERLSQEIIHMTKLKDDIVSRFCIENTKEPLELLANVDCSVQIRALAKLSLHKSLAPVINKFRTRYPDWKESVPRILYATKKMIKNAKKEKSRTEEGQNNSEDVNHEGKSNQIKGASKNNIKRERKVDIPKGKQMKENQVKIPDKINTLNIKGSTFIVSEFSVKSNDHKEIAKTSPKETKVVQPRSSVTKPTSKQHTAINNSKKLPPDPEPKNQNPEKLTDPVQHVDPFFVTCDNKEYLSYAPVLDNDDEISEKKHFKEPFRERYSNSKPKGDRRSFQSKEPPRSKKYMDNINFSKSKINGLQNGGFNKRHSEGNPSKVKEEVTSTSVSLHPSWEAKKKKSSLLPFQGKKVVFDD